MFQITLKSSANFTRFYIHLFTFSKPLSYVAKSRSLVMCLTGSLLLNLASVLYFSGHIISFSFDLPRKHVCYPEHGIMIQRVVLIKNDQPIRINNSTWRYTIYIFIHDLGHISLLTCLQDQQCFD